jgi:hypothetical protein
VSRPRTTLLLAVLALALALPAAAQAGMSPQRAQYLKLAKRGIADARSHWWNSGLRWYEDREHDSDRYPLATIWSIVPQFEALDAVAIAQGKSANRRAVKRFAKKAVQYFDPKLGKSGGYAPYPNPRGGKERAWFDDNGWWGIAFVDAYRATRVKSYLTDARRALAFSASRGWAKGGGMWWDTSHTRKAGEALASNTALAALLFEITHKSKYLKLARKFISWADAHFQSRVPGLYARSDDDDTPMAYVQGPMIGAQLALCRAGKGGACSRAEQLAERSYDRFGVDLNHGPQYDTIYLRWMLELSRRDGDSRWYALAVRNAKRALDNARDSRGIFVRAWDGGSIAKHQGRPGMIRTHAAGVALLAWLAATPEPAAK